MVPAFRFSFRTAACVVHLAIAPAAFAADADADKAFVRQLAAEIAVAPPEARRTFEKDEGKFREFVAGRLHDQRVATYARTVGLENSVEVRAVIGSFIRDTLVQAAVKDLLARERLSLPALEKLAREHYLANRQNYLTPETARIAHILIKADVETMSDAEIAERRVRAESLLARARAGEDFAELARTNSEDSQTVRRGGELPKPVTKDSLVPKFADTAWALRPGEVSEVVRTRFGFHVIRLIEVIPESARPFDEVKGAIVARLENDMLAPKREAFIDRFRDATLDAEVAAVLPALRAEMLATPPVERGKLN